MDQTVSIVPSTEVTSDENTPPLPWANDTQRSSIPFLQSHDAPPDSRRLDLLSETQSGIVQGNDFGNQHLESILDQQATHAFDQNPVLFFGAVARDRCVTGWRRGSIRQRPTSNKLLGSTDVDPYRTTQ